jgi:hypothetical protein
LGATEIAKALKFGRASVYRGLEDAVSQCSTRPRYPSFEGLMPITTWKFMARRVDEPDYRYAGTQHRGRVPLVGEEIELVVENQMVKWTITEILKDRSNRGIDVFTVRVDEQQQSGSRGASM